jgi:hypothetical protein
MKHISHSLALAGMLALALSACSNMHGWGSSRSGTTTSGGESGTGTGSSSGTSGTSGSSQSGSGYEQNNSSGSSGTSGTSGSGTASMGESGAAAMGGTAAGSQDRSQSASVASISPNATVVSIDVVPRQGSSEGDSGTSGTVGSSAAGATGMSAGGDRVYRITARMDDGSTRVVTQESTPDFRAGDRVNLSNGIIAH